MLVWNRELPGDSQLTKALPPALLANILPDPFTRLVLLPQSARKVENEAKPETTSSPDDPNRLIK